MRRMLVTVGAGFIGANFVHHTVRHHPEYEVRVLDALTYAGNRASLDPVAARAPLVHGDICDAGLVDRLVAGCEAYVGYGLAHPARYGVLFSGSHGTPKDYCAPVPLGPEGRPVLEFGAEAFALLVRGIEECAEAGASASTDVVADSTAVWVALHGAVTLRSSLPGFPWPEPETFVRHLVLSLARITGHPDGG